jgi:hypothetical protein
MIGARVSVVDCGGRKAGYRSGGFESGKNSFMRRGVFVVCSALSAGERTWVATSFGFWNPVLQFIIKKQLQGAPQRSYIPLENRCRASLHHVSARRQHSSLLNPESAIVARAAD